VAEFVQFAGKTGFGVFGAPAHWPEGDESWLQQSRGCKPKKNASFATTSASGCK
jgi:hypothetical protein